MEGMNNCFICYKPLKKNERLYHPNCSKKLFGTPDPPELPYAYSEINEMAKDIVKSHITVPGVQAKLSLALENSRNKTSRFSLVGILGNYILKPPVEAYPLMPEIENLTMHLARFFNIDIVPHGLIPLESGEIAYITRRVDRLTDEKKIHMEDMCQLTERLTENKYQGSMEQIGKMIKKFSSNPLFDCIRFFEITLFSFLTGNADMHLKNFSLIYPVKEMVQLSPAYDLLSTRLLISEKDDPEEMALTLNGKKRKFTLSDFTKFSQNLGLSEKQLQNILKRFSGKIKKIKPEIENKYLPENTTEAFKALIFERASRVKII